MNGQFVDILEEGGEVRAGGFVDVLEDRPVSAPSIRPEEGLAPPPEGVTPPGEIPLWEMSKFEKLPSILPEPTGSIEDVDVEGGIEQLGQVGPMTTPAMPEWETPLLPEQEPLGKRGAERTWGEPTVVGAMNKSIKAFNAGFTADISTFIPGQEIGDPYEWEHLPVGISYAAGLILGPGKVVKPISAIATRMVPGLILKGSEGFLARTIKTMATETPGMAAFGTVATTGEALKQDNWEDALNVLWRGTKGGTMMGLTFAGTRGIFWKPQKDRIKRLATGMALLDYQRGAQPFDDRDFWVKVKDYAVDSYFLWGGLHNTFEGLEKEVEKRLKEENLDERAKKEIKKDEVRKEENLKANPYYNLSDRVVEKDAELKRPEAVQEWARRQELKEEAEDVPEFEPGEQVKKAPEGKVSKDGKYLGKARKLKRKLGKDRYYAILKSIGIEKTNQVINKAEKAKVLAALEKGLEEPKVEPEVEVPKVEEPTAEEVAKELPDQLKLEPERAMEQVEEAKKKVVEGKVSKIAEGIRKRREEREREAAKKVKWDKDEKVYRFKVEGQDQSIYRDPESGWWLDNERFTPGSKTQPLYLGDTKKEAIKKATALAVEETTKLRDGIKEEKEAAEPYGEKFPVEEPLRGTEGPEKVKPTSLMKTIAKLINYKGRKFKVDQKIPAKLDSYWIDGSKDTYYFYNTKTGEIAEVHSNHPFFEAKQPRNLTDLPPDIVLVRDTIFQGKKLGLTFYASRAKASEAKQIEYVEEGLKIEEPTRTIPETSEDIDTTRRNIADQVQRFRKGEDLDIDEIEASAELLSVSRTERDFAERWEYEQFQELNETVLDLVRKVREEKGIAREDAEQKMRDRVLEDTEDLLEAESLEELRETRSKKGYEEESEDWERRLAEEGMPEELTFDMLGQQQIYEKALDLYKKTPSLENLNKISRGIMLEGKTKYIEFRRRMKEITGDLWDSVKEFVKDAWNASKEWNKRVGRKGRVILTRGTPQERLSRMLRNEDIHNKEALTEKQNLKEQILKGVKSGEFDGAVRFGNVNELKTIVRTKRLAISDEYGAIHAQPIIGKEDTTFAAYGSYSKHNMVMVIPKEFTRTDPLAKTKEVLIDPKTPVEEVTFFVGNEERPMKFNDLYEAEKRGTPVTLDFLGMQQLFEAIADRVSSERAERKALTKQAIKRREKKAPRATEVDINDIRGLGRTRDLDDKETLKVVKNIFGYKKGFEDLTAEEADLVKLKLIQMEPKDLMENESKVYDDPDIKDSTKKALKRAVKVYDVDDIELGDYLDLCTKGDKLTNSDANMAVALIRAVNEIRPDQGRVIWAYLAPAKRLFGEKFMEPMRRAEVQRLDVLIPSNKKIADLFHGLNTKSREAVTKLLEGDLTREDLSPQELAAADGMKKLYKQWWKDFDIEGYIEQYSPHLPKFRKQEDMIDWAFSRRGLKDFDFWAEHERTGELDARELDGRSLAQAYLRSGLAKKFYSKALEEVKPIIAEMSPERATLAKKWIDTVIRKRPTADEIVANRFIKGLMKKAGVKVDENARYYRQLVSTVLDLNYSAYMGMRPKLALRNLSQQFLIMNEYGYGNYLKGRMGKYKDEVRAALEQSDVYKLRKKQYLVVEDEINRISDLPADLRQKMMWFYRKADIDNVEVAFATGYLNAKKNRPNLPESYAIRAGEKAIHNTQWGYGMDLPYLFKTPTGKFVGQYMSWPIWYGDHMVRMVKERHGAKAARTAAQMVVIGLLLENFSVDYTRTVLLGVMPEALGYGGQSVINIVKLIKSLGTLDSGKIEQAGMRVWRDVIRGLFPGYLASKDIKKFAEGSPEELFLYMRKKKKSRSGKGLGSLGSMGKLGSL